VEHEEGTGDEAAGSYAVVPMEFFIEVEGREDAEDGERDDLLNDLELCGRELVGAETVGRDLQAVLKKRDAPGDKDGLPKWDALEFEMTVPGKGHEDIGANEQKNSPHRYSWDACAGGLAA